MNRSVFHRFAPLLAAFLLLSVAPGEAAAPDRRMPMVVVLDPAHGGSDPGAGGGGAWNEAAITLTLARRVAEELRRDGLRVGLTRTADSFLAAPDRTAAANHVRADRLVSLHATRDATAHRCRATVYWYGPPAAGGRIEWPTNPAAVRIWSAVAAAHAPANQALADHLRQGLQAATATAVCWTGAAPLPVLAGADMAAAAVELRLPGAEPDVADCLAVAARAIAAGIRASVQAAP